jgi:serine protease Do
LTKCAFFHVSPQNRVWRALAICGVLVASATVPARAATDPGNPLIAASDSIEALVRTVSHSVVQVVVTGFRPVSAGSSDVDSSVGRGRSIGSGVVIDAGGYIITNAHVVAGAERIDVIAPAQADDEAAGPFRASRALQAALVGVSDEWDLALLKVEAPDLPALPLAGYDTVRQGQLVFAFGSPDGLRNSVTMGMVSAVARQMEADSPIAYVQTDAAINPGNSGGPLVNAKGQIVGINTFIRSSSGGSDGLGFALPSSLVGLAYPQLRDFGHLRRAIIGVVTQTLTPTIAEGLHLPPTGGLLVSDVLPGGPADRAGIRIGDVLTAVGGERADEDTARLYLHLASLQAGKAIRVDALRAEMPFSVVLTPAQTPGDDARSAIADPGAMVVELLAILGAPREAGEGAAGVVVLARLDSPHAEDVALSVGDVIRTVNGTSVESVDALRTALETVGHGRAIVMQVERAGRLTYVGFQRD